MPQESKEGSNSNRAAGRCQFADGICCLFCGSELGLQEVCDGPYCVGNVSQLQSDPEAAMRLDVQRNGRTRRALESGRNADIGKYLVVI